MFAASGPMSLEAGKQGVIGCGLRRALVHDDDIEAGELPLVLPERLAYHALDAIAPNRRLAVFLGYRESETGAIEFVAAAKYRKPAVAATFGLLENAIEGRSVPEPAVFR